MNEAKTRAELIDPALKAAGRCVVPASRIQREVITRDRQQGARSPSSHIHEDAIIGYPSRNNPCLFTNRRDARIDHPGPGGQNRDRAPVRHRDRARGVCPAAQARGKLRGLLLELFKDQTLEC